MRWVYVSPRRDFGDVARFGMARGHEPTVERA